MGNVSSQSCALGDIESVPGGGGGEDNKNGWNEETHDGLVNSVYHVGPVTLLEQTGWRFHNCVSTHQNLVCVHSSRSIPRWYSCGTARDTASLASWSRTPIRITGTEVKNKLNMRI